MYIDLLDFFMAGVSLVIFVMFWFFWLNCFFYKVIICFFVINFKRDC